MTRKVIHVALNGVTGRMGYRQHLVRSLLAIREQGGMRLEDGTTLYPEPILVGRNTDRLRAIAERHGLQRWTTDLHEVLADPAVEVYFDTQVTSAREVALLKAIEAGKHVYTEKPVATSLDGALRLARAAKAAGITHGVVHDKLFLPGVMKLQRLMHEDFFGRVLSVRLEFGYWVFEGDEIPAQRPSWNYRTDSGGGIVLDMFPHWQYLLTDLFGPVSALYARNTTHIPRRWDESGRPYEATADDASYAVLEFASGAFASVNSSWAVRVNRRELLELQVDGTDASAVAGLRDCAVQHRVSTPMPVWNPDLPDPIDYHALPRPLVGARVRRGRGDGYLTARHGPVLGAGPGADRQDGGPGGRCGGRWRCGFPRGDAAGSHSDALLGAFAAITAPAAAALAALDEGDVAGYDAAIEPTVPLSRAIFEPPTYHYKVGVAFLAWLNGLQPHFAMLAGLQRRRPARHLIRVFELAAAARALTQPDLAVERMTTLVARLAGPERV